MTSFKDQMTLHVASRRVTDALESASRQEIARLFEDWEKGLLTNQSIRHKLEAVVRSSYRSSASVARSVAISSSDFPDWSPAETFTTEYLASLLADVRRNLRGYKAGTLTRAQALFRLEHSAGVASQRGYTDQLIWAYSELEEFGARVEKYWVANFVDNAPCPACTRLHGTSVGLHENFRIEDGEPGVYKNLIGPPRHPNCKCRLFIFTLSLDNMFTRIDFESPEDAPPMVTTAQVKKMSFGVFSAVRATLHAIARFLRGKA